MECDCRSVPSEERGTVQRMCARGSDSQMHQKYKGLSSFPDQPLCLPSPFPLVYPLTSTTVTYVMESLCWVIIPLLINLTEFPIAYTRGLANCIHRPNSSVFVNKVLLRHSHVHSFTFVLWLFLPYKGRVELLEQRLSG